MEVVAGWSPSRPNSGKNWGSPAARLLAEDLIISTARQVRALGLLGEGSSSAATPRFSAGGGAAGRP